MTEPLEPADELGIDDLPGMVDGAASQKAVLPEDDTNERIMEIITEDVLMLPEDPDAELIPTDITGRPGTVLTDGEDLKLRDVA